MALIYDYKHYYLEGKLTSITYTFRKILSMLSPMGVYSLLSHRLLDRFIVLDIDFLQGRGSLKPDQRIVDFPHYWLIAATPVGTSYWAGQ